MLFQWLCVVFISLSVCYVDSQYTCQISQLNSYAAGGNNDGASFPKDDMELLDFVLNLEYLEAEFLLHAAYGYGLDQIAPELAGHGPVPIGGQKARLDVVTEDIVKQLGLQEVGHLSAIKATMGYNSIPRPQLDLSRMMFANIMDTALGRKLFPPFDVYANSVNFLLGIYLIPYIGLNGYVGAIPSIKSSHIRRLIAGLEGVEAGQDAIIRTMLHIRKDMIVRPYGITVADFTNFLSHMRTRLDGQTGVNDEGLVVPACLGAVGYPFNILAADQYSMAYSRNPQQILRILYTTGGEDEPGGFFPQGASGAIAKRFLLKHDQNLTAT